MGDRAPRLLVATLPAPGGEVVLPPDSARHARVLRLRAGDAIELFDGRGGLAQGQVVSASKGQVVCRGQGSVLVPPPTPPLTLLVGITKGVKLDLVARMLTELGVDGLALAQCARSVPEPKDPAARRSRLARISLEACGQSGRLRPLSVAGPAPLLALAADAPPDAVRLTCYERAEAPLPDGPLGAPVWAVVGPEGGLSAEEVSGLAQLGYAQVGLGPQILRAETAAVTTATLLLDRLGRLRG